MAIDVEELKKHSRGLRGSITETLATDATHLEEEGLQLIKFHGSYQQDDRDERSQRRKDGVEKAWQFMVRSKIPGGDLTPEQYLVHDRMAGEIGNDTIRLTNRQGFQMHGILFGSLRDCINRINTCGLTTWGACGDVVRNTTASSIPLADAAHREATATAKEISKTFYPASHGYSEIWLDNEKVTEEPIDPIYLDAYLPRKFKIGIAVPPYNDVDVLSNDVGLVADVKDGSIVGYQVHVGGGFGMSFGKLQTRPALAVPLFYIESQHVIEALKAIVATQRDHGRRDDRSQARLKYLILDRGVDWFREQVAERITVPFQESRTIEVGSTEDLLGWHEQGDGDYFLGVYIPNKRIADVGEVRCRTAMREICQQVGVGLRITSNGNLYLHGVAPADREKINTILAHHGLEPAETLTRSRRMAHACVALPTCGLALAESERVFSELIAMIEPDLKRLGLEEEPILFRMSGCANGCSRPYNADFAFVGRAPKKYAVFVGGSFRGLRLATLVAKSVLFESLPELVATYLEEFVANRVQNEAFTDYWGRTRPNLEVTNEQFHVEEAEAEPAVVAA